MKNFDVVGHLEGQYLWSQRTFGPGGRTLGVCDHIQKELAEIAEAPTDVMEWVDVIILALDGALRNHSPPSVASCLAICPHDGIDPLEASSKIRAHLQSVLEGRTSSFIDIVACAFNALKQKGWPNLAVWHLVRAKHLRNEQRKWPDWRTKSEHEAIEHIRDT